MPRLHSLGRNIQKKIIRVGGCGRHIGKERIRLSFGKSRGDRKKKRKGGEKRRLDAGNVRVFHWGAGRGPAYFKKPWHERKAGNLSGGELRKPRKKNLHPSSKTGWIRSGSLFVEAEKTKEGGRCTSCPLLGSSFIPGMRFQPDTKLFSPVRRRVGRRPLALQEKTWSFKKVGIPSTGLRGMLRKLPRESRPRGTEEKMGRQTAGKLNTSSWDTGGGVGTKKRSAGCDAP